MKKLLILPVMLLVLMIVTSCEKQVSDQAGNETAGIPYVSGRLSDPVFRDAIQNALENRTISNSDLKSVEFLPVAFTPQSFYVQSEDGLKIAVFSTIADENDFLRLNPDGTYTVHIVSQDATNEMIDYSNYNYYVGQGGNMVMNYSGPAELIPIFDMMGNFLGYVYIVTPDENSPATVWHGHGPVQLFGMGPEYTLIGKLTASAGWKKVKRVVELK